MGRRLLALWTALIVLAGIGSGPVVLPPGTPKDRVHILRKALQETLKDKDLLAEAEKAKLAIDPVPGEDLERMITDLFALDAAVLARLKDILYK